MTDHQVEGQFTLHIRSVGEWTTSLHSLVKEEFERQAEERKVATSTLAAMKQSIKRKYRGAKTMITQMSIVSERGVEAEKNFNFVENFLKETSSTNTPSKEVFEEKGNNHQIKRDACSERRGSSKRPIGLGRYISIQEPKTVDYQIQETSHGAKKLDCENVMTETSKGKTVQATRLEKPLDIYIDGPFGSPSSNIYRAEHAVLIGTGIGVTPFASILQSIAHRWIYFVNHHLSTPE